MAKPTPPPTRTSAPYTISAAIGAVAGTLATLATLAAARRSRARATAALMAASPKELRARADVLRAIAAHRDAVKRGERALHVITGSDEHRPPRAG